MSLQSIKDLNIMKGVGIELVGTRECETCGTEVPIYEKRGERISKCMKCETQRTKQETVKEYDPPQRRDLKRRIKHIEHIPHELVNATFEDYIPKNDSQREALDTIYSFLTGDTQSVLFQGTPGLGKSHLFRCAAREIAKQKVQYTEEFNGESRSYEVTTTVLFAKVPELMKMIQQSYNKTFPLTEGEILETLSEVDVLVLDEVGGERAKRDGEFETWSGDILYQIVDHRQQKRNLYNTNYSSKQLKDKYGDVQGGRILSRMASGAKMMRMEGPDHRMKGLE